MAFSLLKKILMSGEGDKIKIDINKSKILYFDNNEQRIV